VPLEQANMTMASDQNTLRIIASSHFVERDRLYGVGSRFSKTVKRLRSTPIAPGAAHPLRYLRLRSFSLVTL
jgi:hypothetical protein